MARHKDQHPCHQPQRGQHNQKTPVHRRLLGPGSDGGQQKGDHHRAGITPDHFMGVPVKTRQNGSALVAEAPQQNGNRGIKRGKQIKRPKGHRPHRAFGKSGHCCRVLGRVVLFFGLVFFRQPERVFRPDRAAAARVWLPLQTARALQNEHGCAAGWRRPCSIRHRQNAARGSSAAAGRVRLRNARAARHRAACATRGQTGVLLRGNGVRDRRNVR